jgi:chloride channel 7
MDLAAVVLLAIVGGLLGALFNFLLNRILRVYSYINE